MKLRIALVVWHDAWDDQVYDEAEHGPEVVTSVGFVVKYDDLGMSLVGCDESGHAYKRPLFIPRGVIQSVKFLKG